MKKSLFAALCAFGFSLTQLAQADVLGVWAGGGMWDWEVSGKVRYQSTDSNNDIDLKNELGWKDDDSGTAFAIIEHPIPVLPNVKVFTTSVETSGTGTISGSKLFGGANFSANVSSSLDLDMTDITLYYEVLDNVVSLDLGLTAKIVDGKVSITETGGALDSATATFDGVVPMGYVGVEIALPLTGLTLGGNLSALSVGDSSVTDTHIYARYTTDFMLGIEAGIKNVNFELDDLDDSYGELDFEGVYAQLFLHF